jgi:enhancer of polycomb-like protein
VLKRELGITDSDDDLIAHKKKKVVPPEPKVIEDVRKDKKGLSKTSNNANIQDRTKQLQQQGPVNENLAGTDGHQQFQPYVKLPPSKIPDMDLETVQHLLKNKDVTMQKFVEEKLKKRKNLDIEFTNFTDDPHNPLFEINIQNQDILDKNHTPYSSITSSFFDIHSRGYIPNIDRFLNKGPSSKDNEGFMFEPETKTISKKFIPEKYNPLLQDSVNTSEPVLTLRKRVGRLGQVYIDRKALIRNYEEDQVFGEHSDEDIEMQDAQERFEDRWKFDSDINSYDPVTEPFSDDPAKLNSISNETQVIRFGSMLLSKAYETLKESILHQRQQVYYQQLQRIHAQQKQQQQSAQPVSSPLRAASSLPMSSSDSANNGNRQTPPPSNQSFKGQSGRSSVPPQSNAVNNKVNPTAIKSEN